jgi:uncharacterized protein YjbI with pentapeptide repeats
LTVMIAPILVLILIQLQFLPYHSVYVTTIHRLAVAGDMGLLLFFWPQIAGAPENSKVAALRHSIWAVVFAVVLFSSFVATFPGETGRDNSIFKLSGMAEYLFHSPVHQVKGQRQRWFSDTLVLTDVDFVSLDDEKVPQQVTVSLRGRNLQGAFLARSDLRKADFTGADLTGANFRDAKLRGAQFGCPLVRVEHGEKSLSQCTILSNAILDGADLRDSFMRQASLRNASLQAARIEGANFEGALLQGALIKDSVLSKVNLWKADLTGAKFENSDLSEARLASAILGGTLFHKVTLRKSDLQQAKILAPALLDVNLLGLSAPQTDWSTALVRNLYESDEAFVLNAPLQGLNTFASADSGTTGKDAFSVAAAEPQSSNPVSALQLISASAVSSRGGGDTESDAAKWKKRLDELQALMCKQRDAAAAVEVFARLSTMPGSEKDKTLAFGPDREAFINRFLDPSCINAAALRTPVCGLLLVWGGKKAVTRKECVAG